MNCNVFHFLVFAPFLALSTAASHLLPSHRPFVPDSQSSSDEKSVIPSHFRRRALGEALSRRARVPNANHFQRNRYLVESINLFTKLLKPIRHVQPVLYEQVDYSAYPTCTSSANVYPEIWRANNARTHATFEQPRSRRKIRGKHVRRVLTRPELNLLQRPASYLHMINNLCRRLRGLRGAWKNPITTSLQTRGLICTSIAVVPQEKTEPFHRLMGSETTRAHRIARYPLEI